MIITDHIKAGNTIFVVYDENTLYLLSGMSGTKRVRTFEEAERALRCNRVPFALESELSTTDDYNWRLIPVPEGFDSTDFIRFANSYYLDPGDYTAGKKYDTSLERCFLCGIGARNSDRTRFNIFADSMDVVIYESRNFIVVSEKGAMKKGFLMICPKAHILSMAQLPEEMVPEYHEVCKDVEEILKATYGFNKNVSFWEHGSAPSHMSAHKKSIMHAHTHVLIDNRLDFRYLQQIQCRQVSDLRVAAQSKYFCYHDGWNGQIYLSMDEEVFFPRQYVRKIIVKEMNLPPEQFDWRTVPFKENIDAQLFSIFHMLQEGRVSKRIMKRTRAFVEGYVQRRIAN